MNARTRITRIGIILWIAGSLAALALPASPTQAGPARTQGAQATWTTEIVYTSGLLHHVGTRSLALDAYGRPHAAFGGDHLYYAHRDEAGWHVSMVDPADNVGAFTSLALDAAGHPHVAYQDLANGDLKYAAYDGTAWRIVRIDTEGIVGGCTSLVLDASGEPQISYLDRTHKALKLAWHRDGAWHTDTVAEGLSTSNCPTLVLDGAGLPHLGYVSDDGLVYARVLEDRVTWAFQVVDPHPASSSTVALALDAQGRPHLAYCEPSNHVEYCSALRHAAPDGTGWRIEDVDLNLGWGADISLALDGNDRPHVAYVAGNIQSVKYAHHDGSAWQVEVIPRGLLPSLALDAAGRPHLTYYAPFEDTLNYTRAVPPTFADPAFESVWQRTDKPVAEGRTARSWMWGPRPLTPAAFEPYADAPGGSRLVQYFEKSRMEINDPNGDPSSAWFVTNGLLVREMVDGWIQLGDNEFERSTPARQAVAGDPVDVNPNCPLYASFTALTAQPAENRSGQKVSATLARDGSVGDDPALAAYPGSEIAYYEQETGHNVPQALWDFMNQRGLIYSGGRYRQGLVVDWLFAMGYPISEPYWIRCTVGGEEKDVLVQLFERRVLTYTPANPAGWRVEMGNVGRHYYTWRYGHDPDFDTDCTDDTDFEHGLHGARHNTEHGTTRMTRIARSTAQHG